MFAAMGILLMSADALDAQDVVAKVAASDREKLAAARAVMSSARYCALITVDDADRPRARTVDPFAPTNDMTVWVATLPGTRKLDQIRGNPNVTLYYSDPEAGSYVTLMGSARIHDDLESKAKWKHPDVEAFWPDYPDGYTLIEVRPSWLEVVSPEVGANEQTWRPQSVDFDDAVKR